MLSSKSKKIICFLLIAVPLLTYAIEFTFFFPRTTIFSSIVTYNQIAQQIGGKFVEVYTPYTTNQDPHDFAPSVSTIKKVYQANIIIGNGLKVDGWLENITQNLKGKTIIFAKDFIVGDPSNYDQHLWYSPTIILKMAEGIELALAAKDPRNQRYFLENFNKFKVKYNLYIDFLNKIKNTYTNFNIAAPESFFNNLAKVLNFNTFTKPIQIATSKDLSGSPQEIAQFIALLKNHEVNVFLYNSQVANKNIIYLKNLAQRYGIPIVTMQETQPQTMLDYFSWQEYQISKLTANLSK